MWQATTIDEYSRVRAANIGATAATWGYNTTTNLLSQIKGTSVQQYDYDFNGSTRNLTTRTNGLKTETFGYDTGNLDRLISVTGTSAQTIGYDPTVKGNIASKTDVGTYTYDPTRKYAVKTITNGLNISTTPQNIVYNAFNKVKTITEGTKTAEFVYNADRQRIRMTLKTSGATTKTRYYFGGSCEREVVGSTTTQTIWIGGDAYTAVAVATKVGTGSWTVYNIFRDHLGTITHLKTGSTITEFSFDAWGRRRNALNWSYDLTGQPALFADRGFTSHEFLADFNLYNMNGRLYDPVVGRFLSPDPFIQDPSFSQSYNRYSYALNNPLKFTDYSGEKWNWNNLNPFYHFQNFMQWVNDNTTGLRQNMVNAKIPDFSVKYNTTFGTGFSVGENPAYYPFYENKIAKGQQGIGNQLAGFSCMGNESFSGGNMPMQQFVGESPLAGGNLNPSKIDWNDSKAVYFGTKEWMKYIANGNTPVGAEYWNVADIYKNVEYVSEFQKFLHGGMKGGNSRSKNYPDAGLRIFVAETDLMKNYQANYIQGIIQNDKLMTITLYGTENQSQGVVVSYFTNSYYYNLWKNFIWPK